MIGLKLMAAGVLLLAFGLGIVIFTDFEPAPLFIGGAACMFIGFVDFITPSHSRGPAVSAGDDASGAFGGDL
jgi:hypothetical protein